jgi:hypothetical protein
MLVQMLVSNVSSAICLALGLLGCSRTNDVTTSVVDVWRRGDVAVVESTAADFFECQVLEAGAGQLKVQRLQGAENLRVGVGDAYRIPASGMRLGRDAWAICQVRPREWVACRVVGGGPVVAGVAGVAAAGRGDWESTVVDALGREWRLRGAGTMIEPTGLTAMNIQRRFEQSSRRANFERSFREAGKPRRQTAWQPAPRRVVLANQQGQWFGAQVTDVDDERVVVRWDGQKGVTDLAKEDVAPQPPACGPVARGDRALRRPSGHGAAWIQVVVVAVDGPDATVEDVERSRTTLPLRDICPLGTPAVSPTSE